MRNQWFSGGIPTRPVALALVALALLLAPRAIGAKGAANDPRDPAPPGHPVMCTATFSPTAGPPVGYDPDSGIELIGKPAPPWLFQRWVRGGPLTQEQLRGRVVLMRFWTENCRFCQATLPAIEQLRRRYGDRGLVVLGAFHPPKAHQKRSDTRILSIADSLGFGGPIACDQDWKTLDRWWLTGHPDRNWVSVSFLIDQNGIVRWVQGGGEYHPTDVPRHHRCDVKFHELEAVLEPMLTPATTATP